MSMLRITLRLLTVLPVILAMTLICGTAAHAQRFEAIVGNPLGNETGQAIAVCPVNGGYVAAGHTSAGSCSFDVVVARIAANGTALPGWHKAYDIGGFCQADYATSVIECTNGDFVISGGTLAPLPCAASGMASGYLMRIDPAGTVVWARAYRAGQVLSVVEATTGNGSTTFAGDLIFCGFRGGTGDGFIARADGATGALIWNQVYTIPNGAFSFSQVIEATNTGAGDVVACGHGSNNVVVARVDGNTGTLTSTLHAIAEYSAATGDMLALSIQELQVAPNAGDLVLAGFEHTGTTFHVNVLRTAPNPCTVNADAVHAVGNASRALAIREINPPAGSSLTPGNLVLTGDVTLSSPNTDMILMELDPGTLGIVTAAVHVYASGVGSIDYGKSIAPVYDSGIPLTPPSDGFIMCGSTWQLATGNKFYIVKTDAAGTESIPCDDGTISYSTSNPGVTVNCPSPSIGSFLIDCAILGTTSGPMGGILNCYVYPKESTPNEPAGAAGLTLSGTPNPVRGGTDVTLSLTSAEAMPVTIMVTDASGRTIATAKRMLKSGANTLALGTGGWAAGAYVITATAGGETAALRIVVVE